MRLASALSLHEGALRASFQQVYGLRLLAGGRVEPTRSLFEVADLVVFLPSGCALGREIGGAASISDDGHLIHALEYTVRRMVWEAMGGKGQPPKPMPFPVAAGGEQRKADAESAKYEAWMARRARLDAKG